eukprot:5629083-Prymnesium_polylepis.1
MGKATNGNEDEVTLAAFGMAEAATGPKEWTVAAADGEALPRPSMMVRTAPLEQPRLCGSKKDAATVPWESQVAAEGNRIPMQDDDEALHKFKEAIMETGASVDIVDGYHVLSSRRRSRKQVGELTLCYCAPDGQRFRSLRAVFQHLALVVTDGGAPGAQSSASGAQSSAS